MLPEHVRLVFLSATTPNALEFSEWIGRMKQRPVYVISTNKRPVPLQHCVYVGGDKLYKIVNSAGEFMENGTKFYYVLLLLIECCHDAL